MDTNTRPTTQEGERLQSNHRCVSIMLNISVYDQRTIFTYFAQWNATTFQIVSIIYSLSLA